jgi:hypothetical protein
MKKVILKKLTKNDIGRRVVYKPKMENEQGIIKSWNDLYVFVVYPGNNDAKKEHWDRYTAAATKAEDIFFLS